VARADALSTLSSHLKWFERNSLVHKHEQISEKFQEMPWLPKRGNFYVKKLREKKINL